MDWKTLMAELKSRNWTHARLQERLASQGIEVGQATLSDLARGISSDPKFALGNALRELHASGLVVVVTTVAEIKAPGEVGAA